MPAKIITVHAVRANTEISSRRKRVRLMPSGFAGIEFDGLVYPLKHGNRIDLEDEGRNLDECIHFVMAKQEIPYANEESETTTPRLILITDWKVDTPSEFETQVHFNSLPRAATDFMDLLHKNGAQILRWDSNHRIASNGKFYNWFASVNFQGSRAELENLITKLLETTPTIRVATLHKKPATDANIISDLKKLNNKLSAQVELLQNEIRKLRNEIVRLTEKLNRLKIQKRKASDRNSEKLSLSESQEIIDLQDNEIKELNETICSMRMTQENNEEEFLKILSGKQTDIDNLELINDSLREQIAELNMPTPIPKFAPPAGIDGFVQRMFPRINFAAQSYETMQAFQNLSDLISQLLLIDGGQNIGVKVVKAQGVKEISKIHTGIPNAESMGRVYYKPDGSGKVNVYVHIKKNDAEQQLVFEWLRKEWK